MNTLMNMLPTRDVCGIVTLETAEHITKVLGSRVTTWAWAAFQCLRSGHDFPAQPFTPFGMVFACVNHSRWLARCPFCPGAALISTREKLFWCAECRMKANAGRPMEVILPTFYQDVEALLLARPDAGNRHWNVGETVDDLAHENREHGIGGG